MNWCFADRGCGLSRYQKWIRGGWPAAGLRHRASASLGCDGRVGLVVVGVLESPRAVGGFGGVAEVADVRARVARQGIRRVFQIQLRGDADARADDHGGGDQHEGRGQPGDGEFRLEAIGLSGGGDQFRGRRLAGGQRGGQRIAAGKSRGHGQWRRRGAAADRDGGSA